jgi:hypothetical protein
MRGPATRDASRRLVGFTVKQTRQVPELGSFLTREKGAAGVPAPAAVASSPLPIAAVNGTAASGAAQPN